VALRPEVQPLPALAKASVSGPAAIGKNRAITRGKGVRGKGRIVFRNGSPVGIFLMIIQKSEKGKADFSPAKPDRKMRKRTPIISSRMDRK
jgi:hypothetical protein